MLKIKNRLNRGKILEEWSTIAIKIKMAPLMEFIKDFIGTKEEFLSLEFQILKIRAAMVQYGQANIQVSFPFRGCHNQKAENSAILKGK